MKKQLVILLEYEEDEDCDLPVRGYLYASDVCAMVESFIEEVGDHISPEIEVMSLDKDDADNFDKVVSMIKESVDD